MVGTVISHFHRRGLSVRMEKPAERCRTALPRPARLVMLTACEAEGKASE